MCCSFRVDVLYRRNTMLDYSIFLSLLTLVCSSGILKREDVNVVLGQDATFSCELPGAVGVKQVIWQQHRDDGILRSMVTFTERSRPQVDDAFVGKVNVTVASVQSTTIVIKNATFADEACYVCTFSVYPSGTERETACLTVHGLLAVTPQLQVEPKEGHTIVSCSATGKPTPAISWLSGDGEELSNYVSRNFTVQNSDSTVTTTSNLTIPRSQFSGKYVTCVATSGSIKHSENIIVEQQTDRETPVVPRYYVLSAVVVISFFVIASCVVILFHRKRKKHEKHRIEIA